MSCEKKYGLRVLLVRRRELCLVAMNKLLTNSPLFHTNWVVPRNVMCILFWAGVFVVFLGMILLVTSKHKGMTFLSWGGVVLGLGLCLLLVCLMLCIHAYCVVANASQTEDIVSYSTPVFSRVGVREETKPNLTYHKDSSSNNFLSPPKFKSKTSAVRFKLVEDLELQCQQIEKETMNKKLLTKSLFNLEKLPQKSNYLANPVGNSQNPVNPGLTAVNNNNKQDHERSFSDHSIDKHKFDVPTAKLPNENMAMTRNFGVSKITVTPIKHNHYEYHIDDARLKRMDFLASNLHAIQQGHIVTGNRPEFNPLFPDGSSKLENPIINESELGRFPLLEIGDSKATVYDNVQYYNM